MADLALTTADKVNVGTLSVLQHTFIASAAITAGAPVYIVAATGKVAHSDGNGAAPINSVWGIACRTVAAGEAVTVIRIGYMDGWVLDALNFGDPIYLSDTVGRLGETAGTTGVRVGTVVPAMGTALGTAFDKIALIHCGSATSGGLDVITDLTDSTGQSGTHDDTLAATTVPTITATNPTAPAAYAAVVNMTDPVTKAQGEAVSAALAALRAEVATYELAISALVVDVAAILALLTVMTQNQSDTAQKVKEILAAL